MYSIAFALLQDEHAYACRKRAEQASHFDGSLYTFMGVSRKSHARKGAPGCLYYWGVAVFLYCMISGAYGRVVRGAGSSCNLAASVTRTD